MSTEQDSKPDSISQDADNQDYALKDADDNDGIVQDDALQKVNPAAAERNTVDHDPHHVAKDQTQYDK